MRRARIGRPSLIGTAARTAVIAGTATAVSGAVAGSAQKKAAAQQATAQQAAAQQAAEMQAVAQEVAAQQVAAMQVQPAAVAPSSAPSDQIEQLKKLAELRQMGVLSEEEFADLKAKVLAG